MKINRKSPLVLVLAAAIVFSSAACSGGETTATNLSVPGGGKWVDSSIRGTITEESEPRLQDDFAAAANK